MKKSKFLLLLIALMTAFTLALVGCGGGDEGDDGEGEGESQSQEQPPAPVVHTLSIDKTSATMVLGDETYVINTVKYDDAVIALGSATYTSSNKAVVSVDADGKFIAKGIGAATVTVGYQGESKTCAVTVSTGGYFPEMKFINVGDQELVDGITTDWSNNVDLSTKIVFNGKDFDDAQVTYVVADPTIGSVVDGVFVPAQDPHKEGTTTVTVTASWNGMDGADEDLASILSATITIKVEAPTSILINGEAVVPTLIELLKTDNPDTEANETEYPFAVEITYDNQPVETSITVEGTKCIAYDATNNKITASKLGGCVLKVSYTAGTEAKAITINVTVKTPVLEYDGVISSYSAIHGCNPRSTEVTFKTILGSDVLYAFDANGNQLEIYDDAIYGIPLTKDGKIDTTITIMNDDIGYNVPIKGYAGIIYTAEDLAFFDINASYTKYGDSTSRVYHAIDTTKPMGRWEGQYILANDIDASGYVHTPHVEALYARGVSKDVVDCGFAGIFDGRGHTISGMTVGAYGLFGYITKGAKIRNVAFTDVTLKDEAYSTVLAHWIQHASVANVYISIKNDAAQTTKGSGFAGGFYFSTFKYVVFETKAGFGYGDLGDSGVLIFNTDKKEGNIRSVFENVYVISDNEVLGYDSSSYYLADGETMAEIPEGKSVVNLTGAKRYASLEAMAAGENDYSTFDQGYWQISEGLPVWKDLYLLSNITFTINGSENPEAITLHTVTDNTAALTVVANDDVENYAPTIKVDANLLTYENGVLTSTGLIGETFAVVTVAISYGENLTFNLSKSVTIHILPTVYDYEGTIENFSAIHGDAQGEGTKLNDVFEGDIQFAYDWTGKALRVEDNKVFGVSMPDVANGERIITICTDRIGYNVTVQGYGGIISTVNDLALFSRIKNNLNSDGKVTSELQGVDADTLVYDGYYILANDIEPEEGQTSVSFIANKHAAWVGIANFVGKPYGLRGTFDGQGHTIRGLNLRSGYTGIFPLINGGTVKNLAIVDIVTAGTSGTPKVDVNYVQSLAWYAIDAHVQDVYVKPVETNFYRPSYFRFGLFGYMYQSAANSMTMERVYVDSSSYAGLTKETLKNIALGDICYQISAKGDPNFSWTDVYTVSKYGLSLVTDVKYDKTTTSFTKKDVTQYYYGLNENYGASNLPTLPWINDTNVSDYNWTATVFTQLPAYRYATVADMVAAGNDYSAFTATGLWQVAEGALTWVGAPVAA